MEKSRGSVGEERKEKRREGRQHGDSRGTGGRGVMRSRGKNTGSTFADSEAMLAVTEMEGI